MRYYNDSLHFFICVNLCLSVADFPPLIREIRAIRGQKLFLLFP